MSFDKTRFTRDPQLDSEGFVMADAKCLGCDGNEPCPRSGTCEHYNSPFRFYNNQTITVQVSPPALVQCHCGLMQGACSCASQKLNPPGWNEPGMAKIDWCEDMHEEMYRG